MSSLGPLVPADETFHHQITQTFATVAQSDRSWTEKVCAMAAPRDGSVQLAFGMGKYPNRGVLDAYAGVSRGVEQWTVRSSRRLAPDVERLETGPIRYEVLEPLQRVQRRAFEYAAVGGKAAAVTRAIPGRFGAVPVNDAFQMRAERR